MYTHTHTHTHTRTQARPTGDKKFMQEYQHDGIDSGPSGRRKQSSRDPACTVFVHNVSVYVCVLVVIQYLIFCVFKARPM